MLANAIKIALGPLLLVQGKRVRRDTPKLPEPVGPRCGGAGPFRLLIVGDSSGAGVGVEKFGETLAGHLIEGLGGASEVSWAVVAKTGWSTSSALLALADLQGPFDLVVTALGVNDVTGGLPRDAAQKLHGRLLDELTGRLAARRVIVSTMPPIGRFPALPWPLRRYLGLRADEYDAALEEVSERYERVERLRPSLVLDPEGMASDGFHPGAAVYREWAGRILGLTGR